MQQEAPNLPNLIRPRLGNGLANGKSIRMSALLAAAPQLDAQRTDQIAALPLGGRIKLDPWSDQVELAKAKPVPLTSPERKDAVRDHSILPFPHPILDSGQRKGGGYHARSEVRDLIAGKIQVPEFAWNSSRT